jgi:hypothetical protein
MAIIVLLVFFAVTAVLGVFSYGFIDPNFVLSAHVMFPRIQDRPEAAIIFLVIILVLFAAYLYFLKFPPKFTVIAGAALILVLSYPALTYDVFNYIATAKVTYLYRENPYIVMPTEIPNEPNLAFTRAANKTALYGPVWIALSAFPHYAGMGNVWRTFIAFKALNAVFYFGFCYLIYRVTKKMTNVIFFAANPLVLIEVLMNGHNDIYMMLAAIGGLLLWQQNRKIYGFFLLAASWLVKGATLVLTPLLFLKNISTERLLLIAYCLLSFVFFVIAPIREELYPWYAVWLIATASFLPLKNHRFIFGFTVVLSFALELRALPYMWMGYYEGPGPLLRSLLTVIPICCYVAYFGILRIRKMHK